MYLRGATPRTSLIVNSYNDRSTTPKCLRGETSLVRSVVAFVPWLPVVLRCNHECNHSPRVLMARLTQAMERNLGSAL